MSSSSSTFWSISGLTVVGGFVAYALYFDQKRRSDPTFRRKLRQQKKKVSQLEGEARKRNAGVSGIPRDALLAMYEKAVQEPMPSSIEERHAFFSQAVGLAEQLSAMGNAADAALYFFQALRAYPNQSELATIYQKTLPEKTLAVVMDLYALDVSRDKSSGLSDELDISEPSPLTNGPPSEASSQDWDKLTDPGTSGIAT